ncbi:MULTISPECIES: phage terminase small subunit [unclassified Pseudomonas]|uniref:phage terminase small subunit n=1 Tax=unclassified Pseudomonas TaxID=196821 RepID=UPI000C88BA82|nr:MULTISPECIES: phage terminase small subunit [unclassified Pseudomonas]PNA07152.1 terminase [Pseudomonas sp. FW305-BF15]PNB82344.1 terminase [Pseudomonas sp. FW305-BF6]
MSLALAHKRRILAQGTAALIAAAAAPLAYSPAEALSSPANAKKHLLLMQASMDEDLKRLSDLKNLASKQTLKRTELLPKYQDFIQRYMDSGLVMQNPVLVQVMVWLFDTEQFEDGLELADFAIEQGQEMPERFKRNVQTFVADAVIEWAFREYNAQRSPEPYLSDLLPRVDGEWDLPEQIPSKYHKLIGMRAMEAEQWETALEHLERSTELHAKAGNETRIAKCRKAIAKQTPAVTGAQ